MKINTYNTCTVINFGNRITDNIHLYLSYFINMSKASREKKIKNYHSFSFILFLYLL